MLALTDAQIGGWVGSFMLPLFRIAAVLMTMPVIGTQLVPVRVRLYLALAFTLVLVPVLPAMPEVDALNLRSSLLVAEQVLIGVALGFSCSCSFMPLWSPDRSFRPRWAWVSPRWSTPPMAFRCRCSASSI